MYTFIYSSNSPDPQSSVLIICKTYQYILTHKSFNINNEMLWCDKLNLFIVPVSGFVTCCTASPLTNHNAAVHTVVLWLVLCVTFGNGSWHSIFCFHDSWLCEEPLLFLKNAENQLSHTCNVATSGWDHCVNCMCSLEHFKWTNAHTEATAPGKESQVVLKNIWDMRSFELEQI